MVYGFFSWLVPFAISFAAFPLKKANGPAFESFMSVALAGWTAAAALFARYVRSAGGMSMPQAAAIGALWCVMNIAFDLPLFLEGPMKMSFAHYLGAIGLGYLAMPAITIGAARVRTA